MRYVRVQLGSDGKYWVYGYTPATLSPAPVVSTAETTATVTCGTTITSGTMYLYINTTGVAPSVTNLKNGTGATYSTSRTVDEAVESFSLTGLTANTRYYTYWLQTYDDKDSGIFTSTVSTAAPAPSVGTHDITGLPLDGNGWHDLAAMVQTTGKYTDARIVYVSSSTGNNTTAAAANSGNGYYTKGHADVGTNPFSPTGSVVPYRTVAAAWAKIRDGYPDIIVLKRGDTFDVEGGTDWNGTSPLSFVKNGRSQTERLILSSYGAGALPIIETNNTYAIQSLVDNSNPATYWGASYFIIAHLDFYSPHQDTTQYTTYGSFPGYEEAQAISLDRYGFHNLIEGCKFRYIRFEWNTRGGYTSAQNGSRPWPRSEYCMFRRNFLRESYNAAGGVDIGDPPLHTHIPNGSKTGDIEDHLSHAQNMHTGNHYKFILEENVCYQGGWSAQISSIDTVYGHPTLFRHDAYLSHGDYVYDALCRNNIFAWASSVGLQQRPGGRKFNNLFIHNPLASNMSSYWDNELDYNVTIGGWKHTSGYYNGDNGAGFQITCPGTTNVHHNIFTQVNAHGENVGTQEHAFKLKEANYATIGIVPVTNVTVNIHDNITYKWNGEGFMSESGTKEPLLEENIDHITIQNNVFHNCDYFGAWYQTITDKSKYTFGPNTYHTYTATQPFNYKGTKMTLASWKAATGDTTTALSTGALGFSDPERDIESYLVSINAPETTWREFIERALDNDITNWDSAYTALEVNPYIRAGFDMAEPA